jgi:uncharacterized protein YjiS (DUF1127 family)
MKPFEISALTEATCFGLRPPLVNGWKRLRCWYKAKLTYKVLAGLDDRALKDIGICRRDLLSVSCANGAVLERGDR